MADNETIADIIAEMRKISARKYRLSSENGGAYGDPGVFYFDFAQFARVISDRLEAAHRRELETKDSVIQTLSAARDDELDRHRREVDALKRRRSELDADTVKEGLGSLAKKARCRPVKMVVSWEPATKGGAK